MYRQFFSFILATALFAAIFTSCDKDDEKIFTVSFVSNGGGEVEPQTVKEGEKATEPQAPTRENFGFGGWYADNNTFNNRWNFATAVTADMILYAKWNVNEFTVTFDSRGGSTVAPQSVTHGDKAIEPETPSLDGYIFDGWYKEVELTNEWKFDTDVVTADITLYAKWYIQLPEIVTYITGNYDKYVYDEQNRIKTIVSYNQAGIITNTETFTYNGNDLEKRETEGLTMEFTKSETGITIKRSWTNGIVVISTLDLDSNGLPVEHKESDDEHGFVVVTSYQIYGGNLLNLSIKQKFDDGTILEHNNTTYKYGTDKSPFYHCETPKWFLFWFYNFTGSQDNIIEQTWGENKGKYEYIFDNAGFPTKRTETYTDKDNVVIGVYVTDFKYIKTYK